MSTSPTVWAQSLYNGSRMNSTKLRWASALGAFRVNVRLVRCKHSSLKSWKQTHSTSTPLTFCPSHPLPPSPHQPLPPLLPYILPLPPSSSPSLHQPLPLPSCPSHPLPLCPLTNPSLSLLLTSYPSHPLSLHPLTNASLSLLHYILPLPPSSSPPPHQPLPLPLSHPNGRLAPTLLC